MQSPEAPPREHPWLVGVALEPLRGRLFLRVSEVAQLTEADPRTIRRAIELEQIEAVRLGDSTIRIPAAPFWALCGLDPVTLEPVHDDDVDLETPTDAEAEPSTDPATATIHAFVRPKTGELLRGGATGPTPSST